MSRNILQHLLRTTAAVAALAPVAAFAQATPASQGFEEIIVTAQKRAESLQEVPIQVSAFTAKAIEDAGIKTTRDFVALVPNMSFDESFTYLNSFVVVRGLTQINNADAPIAIVIDGVPQNNQKQFKMNLIDIERIEVLKGPQGALYGRNASGGAVNIVTKQPTNDFEGFVNGTYGNGDAWELSGGVSGPIVEDKVLFRVAGYYKQDDGRIDNTFLNEKTDYIDHDYGIRGLLKVNATDKLTLDFRGSYQDFKAGGLYDAPVFSGDANDIQNPASDFLGTTFGDIKELTFKFDYDMDFATLTGITGYTDLKEYNRGDIDFTNTVNNPGGLFGFFGPVGQGQNLDTEMLSQELRLVSASDQRLRWIVGGYYIHTDRKLKTRLYPDVTHTPDQFDTNPPLFPGAFSSEDNSNNAYAIFGQLDFDIMDNLTLSGALRYDKDKREQTDVNTAAVRKTDFDAVQPKATLTYKFNEDQLVYATYSTGFRSGGFNAPAVRVPIFKDETLQNFEGGFKTSWLDRRLIVNGAVYYQKVDDFQFFFIDVLSGGAQVIDNIDKVDIWGVELEVQAIPVEGLQVFAAVGTTDSEIKGFSSLPADVGNKTPKNTTWKLNIGFQYTAALTDDVNGVLRVDYEHRGKKFWHPDNVDVEKPLDLISARVGVEGEAWGVYVWGKNLTDEKYYADYNSANFSGLPYDLGFLAQPRTYGVEGRYKF